MAKVGINAANKGMDDVHKMDITEEIVFGALAGTALAALTLLATNGKYKKKVALDKKLLDDTYSPIQRRWSEELEKLNKEIMIKTQVGTSIGSLASLGVTMNYKHRLINEAIGVSIGGKIGKSITSLIIRKKINEYKHLLLEYEDSLSFEQKKLRLELMKSTNQLGIVWTLGCIGGLVSGAVIGNQMNKT